MKRNSFLKIAEEMAKLFIDNEMKIAGPPLKIDSGSALNFVKIVCGDLCSIYLFVG